MLTMEVLTIAHANIDHCHYHGHQPGFHKPSKQNISLFTNMNNVPDREETPSPSPAPGTEGPDDASLGPANHMRGVTVTTKPETPRPDTPKPAAPDSEREDVLMQLRDPKTPDPGSPTVQDPDEDQNDAVCKPATRPIPDNPPTPPKTPKPKPKPKRHGEAQEKLSGIVSSDPIPILKPDGPVPVPDPTPKPDPDSEPKPDGEPGPDAKDFYGSCTKRYDIVFEDEVPAPLSINKEQGHCEDGRL
jgi:hypothetical protein